MFFFFFDSDEKVELMEVLRIRNSPNLMFLTDLFNSSKVSECLDLRLLKLLFVFVFNIKVFEVFFTFLLKWIMISFQLVCCIACIA